MARRRPGGIIWVIGLGLLCAVGSLLNPSTAPSPSGSVDPETAAPLFSPPTSDTSSTGKFQRKQVLYVTASKLNVRATPDSASEILLSAPQGTSVVAVSRSGKWFEVELSNGSTGWMNAQFLSVAKPRPPAQVVAEPPKKPAPDPSAVVRAIIADSIASYPGNCPCPYNTDRAGRSCGRRSAWSKAGGYAPLCYPDDVTPAMIEKYLARSR
jgi:hypothetical protein